MRPIGKLESQITAAAVRYSGMLTEDLIARIRHAARIGLSRTEELAIRRVLRVRGVDPDAVTTTQR